MDTVVVHVLVLLLVHVVLYDTFVMYFMIFTSFMSLFPLFLP